jgi:hypothetical protein
MKTGNQAVPNDKAYAIIDKLENFGEKTGFYVNHKFTKLGMVAAGVITVAVFGTAALGKALYRGAVKR